jgi:hypothetical protein
MDMRQRWIDVAFVPPDSLPMPAACAPEGWSILLQPISGRYLERVVTVREELRRIGVTFD